jgi:hypothetical protein
VNDINNLKKELEDQIYELDEIWSELGRQDYDNFDFNKNHIYKNQNYLFLSSPDFNSAKSIKELDMESLIPVMKGLHQVGTSRVVKSCGVFTSI